MTKLTKVQEAALSYIPEAQREAAKAQMLSENEARLKVVKANRETFSVKVNENGNLVIRGIGNRFPLGLRPDSAETLLAHAEEIRAVLASLKK